MSDIALALISFALTFGAMIVLIKLAPRLGLLDHPGQRKQHDAVTPAVGGLALYVMMAVLFLTGIATTEYTVPLLVAATIVTLIGALDDRSHISPRVRLAAHFAVALVIVYGAGIRLEHLGSIGLNGEQAVLGPFASAVTIFGIMSVINAMNFIDGLDGLAGGIALIAVAGLWLISTATGHPASNMIPMLTGGLTAFLFLNAPWLGCKKAAIFLGDAGSTLIGMLLALLMVEHSQGAQKVISPVVALWLLAIPLIDLLAIVIRRIIAGRHPFQPDREHLHHILTRTTDNETRSVIAILIIAIICAAIGILGQLYNWPKNVMFYTFLIMFVAGYWSLKYSWRMAKLANTSDVRG